MKIVLDSTAKSIRAKLGAAHTTNPVDFTFHYADVTASAFTEGSAVAQSNGTTNTEVLAAPSASTRRIVTAVSIFNNDTVSQTVTLYLRVTATDYGIIKRTLAAGEWFIFGEAALGGSSSLDQDLVDIAALTPSNDDIIQRKSGAWTNRTLSQLSTDMTELIQDIVGAMVTGNTETNITVTYQDSDGTIDFEVTGGGGGGTTFKNPVINGDMMISSRGTTFDSTTMFPNNDDGYILDRFYLLTDGNDIFDVTQNTADAPTDQLYCMRLDVETINKKGGFAQIIEQKNCVGFIGQTCTFSFKAKVSSTTKLDNIKAAIIAWSGTADTVTSDIISAWGIEGTNPTLIANATYENTPANLNVTTSWATYSVSAAIDTASAKNIILFIWSDVTDTTLGDFIYITDVQLEAAAAATAFERLPYQVQEARCQFYGLPFFATAANYLYNIGMCTATTQGDVILIFPVEMRANVSLTQSGNFRIYQGGAINCTVALAVAGKKSAYIQLSVVGATAQAPCLFQDRTDGSSKLYFSAEL